MCLGWLKVIIDEEIYDKDFVNSWATGFEELKARVDEYPVERVAEITGCDPEQIRIAARTYATAGPSIIPWTPITDMQRNSTSAIRLHSILRAICGYVDVKGGEILHGFNPSIVPSPISKCTKCWPKVRRPSDSDRTQIPLSPIEVKPLCSIRARVWGHRYANQITGCFIATHPPSSARWLVEAHIPVKAFFVLGNNTLMSYANMPLTLGL